MYANSSAGVVGGGLVGALEACMLAKQGLKVTLFESRHDGRNEPSYYGRSINLAISHRGISALKQVNLDYIVAKSAIPMGGRMIHDLKGNQKPIPYDPDNRCIYSIQRATFNNFLLNKAEQEFGVTILFNHRLVDMDPKKGELFFRVMQVGESQDNESDRLLKRFTFDLILGCDGARSMVRNLLSRQSKMEVSQTFIDHSYLEFHIKPTLDGQFKVLPNYLHIWPRGKFMMIALPNGDRSFTCTCFVPNNLMDELKTSGKGLNFFKKYFPDAIELIGESSIEETVKTVRASPLISIKCDPYHYSDKVVLLGDSAHAMVPFYGQGMNCGFEDCLVFDELMRSSTSRKGSENLFGNIIQEYSRRRVPNGQSMSDLAMYNYVEMRDLVNTWSFRSRKLFDDLMYRMFRAKWVPLYTMVTFTQIPINQCVERRKAQDRLLKNVGYISAALCFIMVKLIGLKYLGLP